MLLREIEIKIIADTHVDHNEQRSDKGAFSMWITLFRGLEDFRTLSLPRKSLRYYYNQNILKSRTINETSVTAHNSSNYDPSVSS